MFASIRRLRQQRKRSQLCVCCGHVPSLPRRCPWVCSRYGERTWQWHLSIPKWRAMAHITMTCFYSSKATAYHAWALWQFFVFQQRKTKKLQERETPACMSADLWSQQPEYEPSWLENLGRNAAACVSNGSSWRWWTEAEFDMVSSKASSMTQLTSGTNVSVLVSVSK